MSDDTNNRLEVYKPSGPEKSDRTQKFRREAWQDMTVIQFLHAYAIHFIWLMLGVSIIAATLLALKEIAEKKVPDFHVLDERAEEARKVKEYKKTNWPTETTSKSIPRISVQR